MRRAIRGEATSRAFSADNSLNLSDPYSNLTLAGQSSALAEMSSANTSASTYLPDIKDRTGLKPQLASLHLLPPFKADARNNGAVSTGPKRILEGLGGRIGGAGGGISGFANYLSGNTMG